MTTPESPRVMAQEAFNPRRSHRSIEGASILVGMLSGAGIATGVFLNVPIALIAGIGTGALAFRLNSMSH